MPEPRLKIGSADGRVVGLTRRQRSQHVVIYGATGSGKTTLLERAFRHNVRQGRGTCLVDPHTDLYQRGLEYCCWRRDIGCRVPDVILFNPSDGEWVTPFNPFVRGTGDLSTQVDRRVQATLRAWGQHSGDQTPRLEKWLRCIYSVLIECNLTIVEAGYLIDQTAGHLRAVLTRGLTDSFVRAKLDQLAAYKPAEFLTQVESVENRLMRFLCSGVLRRSMGVGTTALDYARIMDEGKILLVNLGLSDWLSDEQARLLGTLIVTEFFEAAMRRPSGSRPYDLIIDEAGLFVTPELGRALNECRKKGLHLTLAVQHLAQFKTEDALLYKSVKNSARTKIVFAVPDRQDALELSDDLFADLADPQVKFVHRRLNHLIRDVRQTSTTTMHGASRTTADTHTMSQATGSSSGWSAGTSESQASSHEQGRTVGRSASRTQNWERGRSFQWHAGEQESHGWGESQTTSYQQSLGRSSSSGSVSQHGSAHTEGRTNSEHGEAALESHTTNASHGSAQTVSSSEAESYGEASGHTYQRTTGSVRSQGGSRTRATTIGQQTGTTVGEQISSSTSRTTGQSSGTNGSESVTDSVSDSATATTGTNHSVAHTNQPGTRHFPFWEEDPEHWTLEERRWKASEQLMLQPTGHCHVAPVGERLVALTVPKPPPFYLRRTAARRWTQAFHERHSLPAGRADELIAERQASLLRLLRASSAAVSRRRGRPSNSEKANPFSDVIGTE